jgi:hypothetical protein
LRRTVLIDLGSIRPKWAQALAASAFTTFIFV